MAFLPWETALFILKSLEETLHKLSVEEVKEADHSRATSLFVLQSYDFQVHIPESFAGTRMFEKHNESDNWLKSCNRKMDANRVNENFTLVPFRDCMISIGCS